MDSLIAPVTLIVKSCNQQFEDQVIRCEMNWTIRKLKQQLAEVYPTKPKTDEQKLIYSGQLLHDGIVLKDILRQYEGQNTHTVHLVFTPKQMKEEKINRPTHKPTEATNQTSTVNSNNNSDGLRQRSVPNSAPSPNQNSTFVNASVFYNGLMQPAAQLQSNDYLSSQQAAMQAWMQQAYVQYVNQYMNMLQLGAQATPLYASATTANATTSPQFAYFSTPASTSPPPAQPNNAPTAVAAPVQPEQQPAQRRFPNIVVEEPQENRDWLDISYFMLRISVILTVIYIYSSPVRCLAVLSIGIALYLYRRGVFRTQLPPPANPAQEPANQNDNAVQSPEASDTTSMPPQEQNRMSWITMARTFILSFIFSLIPETPAV